MAVPVNPRIIVQSDWDHVLREDDGKVWVTFRNDETKTRVHGSIKCHAVSATGQPYVSATDGFSVEEITKKLLTISYHNEELSQRCRFQAPQLTFATVHQANKSVISMDVSQGGLAVSSDTQGNVNIWTTNNGEVRRQLSGHYGDVYTCRFFPSGVVVLTGGADTQLKIWSAETGQCAATLTGHKAGINDTCIVERGRNIVSVSRDGTARLWDCGSQTCLGVLSDLGGIINGCSLGVTDSEIDLLQPEHRPTEKEVMTEGKLLLLAVESGHLSGYGLHSRKEIFSYKCSSAVNCCSFLTEKLVVCGTDDSSVYLMDLRNTSCPLQHIRESRAAILSLLPYRRGLFVSTGDGSCFFINEGYTTELELTGPDCDPVYKVVSDGTYIYSSCRDGLVRKYKAPF